MTPDDCRAARERLHLSQRAMAVAVGMSGHARSVGRYEAPPATKTARAPFGPLRILYQLILAGKVTLADLRMCDNRVNDPESE